MKITLSLLLVTFALPAGAVSIYISDFDTSLGDIGTDMNGQDGWFINDTTDQFSFVAGWNGGKAIGLGDVSEVVSAPIVAEVTLTRMISRTIGSTLVSLDFALIDSTAFTSTGPFLNRDRFGFSFLDGLNELFSLAFVPEVPAPLNPDDPSENFPDGGKWFVYYSVNGEPEVQLNLAIFEGATYNLDLVFNANADPDLTDFDLLLTGNNTLGDSIVGMMINSGTAYDRFGIFWGQVGMNPYGSGLILVNSISVIPEPAVPLLLALGTMGLIARRRRA